MRTNRTASSLECPPTPGGHSRVAAAKKLFCISQLGVGCSPATILALADILLAAGNVEESVEFVNFAYEYFDREDNDKASLFEETFAEDAGIRPRTV